MIPGSAFSMEMLLQYHSQGFYKHVFDNVFSHMDEDGNLIPKSELISKMNNMGFTSYNPTLSQLEECFKVYDKLKSEFAIRSNLAGSSNLQVCIESKINEIRKEYEVPLNYTLRGYERTNISLDIDVRNEDIKWPPSYIAYHCKQGGVSLENYCRRSYPISITTKGMQKLLRILS